MAFNPRWDAPIQGTINRDGYEIHTGNAWGMVRWRYHSNAFFSENLVAFQSAVQLHVFRLFPRRAIESDQQWQLLQSIAAQVHCSEQRAHIAAARTELGRALVVNKDRDRLLPVPSDATPFAGAITHRDMPHLSSSVAQKRLVNRSYWYAGLATLGVAAIVAGLVGFVLRFAERDVGPTPTYAVVTVLIVGGVLAWCWWQSPRHCKSEQVYAETKGFVSDRGLVFDYAVSVIEVPWNELLLEHQDDQLILLREAPTEETVVMRRDMFASSEQWRRLADLARGLVVLPESPAAQGSVLDEQ
jgi:hypothetical protein